LKGQVSDIKINLVIGANLTVDILFKKESIITPTAFNMSGRVRVFSDDGHLVGEWMTSQGVNSTCTSSGTLPTCTAVGEVGGASVASYGGLPVKYGNLNYIPVGTTILRTTIAGLPMLGAWHWSNYKGDPVFANSRATGFEIDALDLSYFPNMGIDGYPNYQGGYSVEVDFVNWYNPTSFYPPPAGLLMGESFHTVPGHPENPFGWTEVAALSTAFVGHSMAPNHLGPYAQRGVWSLTNAPLSGSSSGIFEVDLRGYISGVLYAFTWSGEFRTLSWANVQVLGAGNATFNSYSWDGIYELYLDPGAYTMTITEWGPGGEGHQVVSASISVGDGQSTTGQNFYIEQSQIPIPEFTGLAVVAFSALAASLYLLRRRRR